MTKSQPLWAVLAVAAGIVSACGSHAPAPVPVAIPTFAPPGGTFSAPQAVTITSATPGAELHYTTNGDVPTQASPLYAAPIQVTGSMTLKVLATAPGFVAAAVQEATYDLVPGAPAFEPVAGAYEAEQLVAISSSSPGAAIHYTLDGSEPTELSATYSTPLLVRWDQVVSAVAIVPGWSSRPVTSAEYIIGGGFLLPGDASMVAHVVVRPGATNYISASSSPCWAGDVVNSPHFLFYNTTCVNDATTGPDGLPADQVTKAVGVGSFYRVLGAADTIPSSVFSSTAVGMHPTASGYLGTGAACSAPPASCACSACITLDGGACAASVSCTASISANTCNAYAAIDALGWTKVSAIPQCASPATTTTCSYYPGRPGLDAGATAFITDVMCQDGPPSEYIPTSGVLGSTVARIGSISGVLATKGAQWNQVGGIRQNNPVATTPPRVGVGPMITSYGYLEYPDVDDPMDLATFTACAVVVPSPASLVTTNVLANNHQDAPVDGWQAVFQELGSFRLFGNSGGLGTGTVAQPIAWVVGVPNLACWGFDAATSKCYLRQNKGPLATSAGNCRTAPELAGHARLGTHHDLLLPFLGSIVEYGVYPAPPTAELLGAVAAQVESRGGITLP